MTVLTKKFWTDALERALKTVAQAMVALLTAGATGLLAVDWVQLLSVAGLAGVVSLLTSVATAGVTQEDSASLVHKEIK